MRVNLSTRPEILEVHGFLQGLRAAVAKVTGRYGLRLEPARHSATLGHEAQAKAELENLISHCETQGATQSIAAAVLIDLALDGRVMLPAVGTALFPLAPADYDFKLTPFMRAVDDGANDVKQRWIDQRSHLQLLLATDCRKEGEFEISQFVGLHDLLLEHRPKKVKFSLLTPEYVLLRAVEVADPSALGRDIRHGYVIWRVTESFKSMSFSEFMADPKNLEGVRIHGHLRERIELKQHVEARKARENARKAKERADRQDSPYVSELLAIARSNTASAPEDYFAALRGGSNVKGFRPDGWLDEPIPYPGRPNTDVASIGAKWFIAFRAYLTHRRKDYETDKQVRSALVILADYLLLYLPWWFEVNPDTTLKYPSAPKQFLRYFYVDRTRFHSEEAASLGSLPKTLNELLTLRRPTPGSRNYTRLALEAFFKFVLTYFEDNTEFVKKGMENPIRTEFDNEVAGRRTKTNKVPFAEDVYPFLVQYGQAVEAFGEFLQQEAYARNRFRELPYGSVEGYRTAEWGFVPIFRYRGKLYRVEWVPSIYLVSKRTLQTNPVGKAGLYVNGQRINSGKSRNVTLNFPHLTVVRLLNAMVETGLRGQSVQWLDRRSFDQLASPVSELAELYGNPQTQSFHSLYVNTDKTHEEWRNFVPWRVRRSLLAERYFQDSVADEYCSIEVDYEDREHSRFMPVLALFRSDRSAKPFSDTLYSNRWVEFLYARVQQFGPPELSLIPFESTT